MALYLVKSGFSRWSIVIGSSIAVLLLFLVMIVVIGEDKTGAGLFFAFAAIVNIYYVRMALRAVDISVKADKVILTGLFSFRKEFERKSVSEIKRVYLFAPACRIVFSNGESFIFLADGYSFMLKSDYSEKLLSRIRQNYK